MLTSCSIVIRNMIHQRCDRTVLLLGSKIALGNSQPGNPHFETGLAAKEIDRIQLGHSGVPSYSCLQATRLVTLTT